VSVCFRLANESISSVAVRRLRLGRSIRTRELSVLKPCPISARFQHPPRCGRDPARTARPRSIRQGVARRVSIRPGVARRRCIGPGVARRRCIGPGVARRRCIGPGVARRRCIGPGVARRPCIRPGPRGRGASRPNRGPDVHVGTPTQSMLDRIQGELGEVVTSSGWAVAGCCGGEEGSGGSGGVELGRWPMARAGMVQWVIGPIASA
jgi:hypothetical protein